MPPRYRTSVRVSNLLRIMVSVSNKLANVARGSPEADQDAKTHRQEALSGACIVESSLSLAQNRCQAQVWKKATERN